MSVAKAPANTEINVGWEKWKQMKNWAKEKRKDAANFAAAKAAELEQKAPKTTRRLKKGAALVRGFLGARDGRKEAATAAAGENAAAKAAAAAKTGDGEKGKPKTVDPPLRF